jgi:hypothetical protein
LSLSEKVRIEIFIPDSSNKAHRNLLEELATEFSYAFGGCTEASASASGSYRSFDGLIISEKIHILFSDAPLQWERDRLTLGHYIDRVKRAAERALELEEVVLISVFSVCHAD